MAGKADREIQECYIQMQMMKKKADEALSEKSLVEGRIEDLKNTVDAVKYMSTLGKNSEILASLGTNVFFEAYVKDPEKILINLGAGVIARKSNEDVLKSLESQMEHLRKISGEIDRRIETYAEQSRFLEEKMIKLSEAKGD